MTAVKSFIRYPGSKSKIVDTIRRHFPDSIEMDLWKSKAPDIYCEPFVGAGAAVISMMPTLPKNMELRLNDKDYWLVCMWVSVRDTPKELCEMITRFKPTGSAFYEFKEQDGDWSIDPIEAGFRKLALHQISFSGLGAMAGGPLGGKAQNNSKYNPECRWRPERLKRDVVALHHTMARFRHVEISCKDFDVVLGKLPPRSFVYLDPPYYEKGPILYKHSMDDADHARLARTLHASKWPWVLSYDDHPRIRELYQWAEFSDVNLTYTMATSKTDRRPKNREVIITRSN